MIIYNFMINNFNKWLVERSPANAGRIGVGGDPTMSALHKINQNQGRDPFGNSYTGARPFQSTFGLDDQEMAALNKLKLTTQDSSSGGGFGIDKNRFDQAFKQFTRMSPTNYQPKAITPPPPQNNMAQQPQVAQPMQQNQMAKPVQQNQARPPMPQMQNKPIR